MGQRKGSTASRFILHSGDYFLYICNLSYETALSPSTTADRKAGQTGGTYRLALRSRVHARSYVLVHSRVTILLPVRIPLR